MVGEWAMLEMFWMQCEVVLRSFFPCAAFGACLQALLIDYKIYKVI